MFVCSRGGYVQLLAHAVPCTIVSGERRVFDPGGSASPRLPLLLIQKRHVGTGCRRSVQPCSVPVPDHLSGFVGNYPMHY